MTKARTELVSKLIPRSAGASAQGAAALDHETIDDPVERQAVVKRTSHFLSRLGIGPLFRAFGQTNEVRHGSRSFVIEETDLEVPFGRAEIRKRHSSMRDHAA